MISPCHHRVTPMTRSRRPTTLARPQAAATSPVAGFTLPYFIVTYARTEEVTMNRLCALPMLLAAMSMPAAAAVSVQAANGDWSKLPQLNQRGYDHLSEKMQAKLYEIAGSQQCPSFKLVGGRLDLRMTFAVQYAPDGSLSKLIIPQLNCAEAESVAGGALLEMVQAGDYGPTGKSANGWYQGTLGFSFAGEQANDLSVAQQKQAQATTTQQGAAKTPDPNEIVCEKVHEIGSRLATTRTCMTRAQWAENKRLTRQQIEQIQTQRPCYDHC
jgi:hypothetical protein